MECFEIRNLSFSYPEQEDKALCDLSFTIQQGEFVTLCGPSGCGKSTLLRQLKTAFTPSGKAFGQVMFQGRLLSEIGQREQCADIGFVLQSPDNQIITDKVWHELAFGLESLGFETPVIRRRVAEMASFFGIQNWFHKNVEDLSGGQKQILNLASIMALQPSVLILDEPTSQLDPIAASEFLATLSKINRELGITVIITEHRLEEVFPMSDRVLVLDSGRLICDGTAAQVGKALKMSRHSMFLSMPVPMRVYAAVPNSYDCPITVREGREWLSGYAMTHELKTLPDETMTLSEGKAPLVELDEVWFRYQKDQADVVRGLSIKAYPGEMIAILGGNGTGKTTALSLISGINKPNRGKVLIKGKEITKISSLFDGLMGVLPQNPQSLFVKKTVREDLFDMLSMGKLSKAGKESKITDVLEMCRLQGVSGRHPYDLSGGEQQRAALAKVLLLEPEILLLDEPTKGMDAEFKQTFASILDNLLHKGVTIILVSHDIEFCASHANRCAMFFDGNIVNLDTPRTFFTGNYFYTTAANRMARHLIHNAVTADDIVTACGVAIQTDEPEINDRSSGIQTDEVIISGGAGGEDYFEIQKNTRTIEPIEKKKLLQFVDKEVCPGEQMVPDKQVIAYKELDPDKHNRIGRTIASMLIILFAVPLTIYSGVLFLDDRKYYFISVLVVLEAMLPFVLLFESRKPRARELIIISVLCALGVAGRAAFFMLPQVKPVAAIVIIAGVAFGGETGFLVGAITMLVSGVMFGQGTWTPWQMFAMGMIGFFSGVLFRKGFLVRDRLALCIFGGLATIFVYGGIMNPAAVIMFQHTITWQMLLAAYIAGFPADLLHASATIIFLWFISLPMLEKLERIKIKYGLGSMD